MCKAKPYPRCSSHAGRKVIQARHEHEANPVTETKQVLDTAKREYLLTPAGIRMVRDQGKTELAANLLSERRKALETARRISKYSTSLEGKSEWWMGDSNLRPNLDDPTVAKAYALAVSAHEGVNRKSGHAYINHPLRTAKHLENLGYNHEVIAVALLHDAVEDSDLTLEDLRWHGFNERIVSGVDSVTKRKGEETYEDAVHRASRHPIGRLVKLSDNLDNSSPEQLKPFNDEKRAKQLRKYLPARRILIRAIHLSQRTLDALDPKFGFTSREYSIKIPRTAG